MSSISLINAAKVIKKQLVLFFFSDYFWRRGIFPWMPPALA